MTAIFITGTGTDVGKTHVAARLIGHFLRMGRGVTALKPVVSGFDPARSDHSDPAVLLRALGLPATMENIARISPWRFRAPVSPDQAARREGRRIDVDQVIGFCRSALAQCEDILLIEGVGGIMVPLDGNRTVLDVMTALRLPLVLVTGSYLGTLSHTLTALEVLSQRAMTVSAVIVSETAGASVPLEEIVAGIERFAAPVIGLPRQPPKDAAHQADAFGALFKPLGLRPR